MVRVSGFDCCFIACSTPVGRVMNRFSGDINIIDEVLPGVLQVRPLRLRSNNACAVRSGMFDE